MSDLNALVEWLRWAETRKDMSRQDADLMLSAADEIERLRAERDTLRALLAEAIQLRIKLFRHSDAFGDTDQESDEKVAMRDPYASTWSAALREGK
jgi:hypothetical protein